MGSIFSVLNLIHLVEKYQGLVAQVVAKLQEFKGTPAGGTVTVPAMTFDVEGERWTIAEHTATRES